METLVQVMEATIAARDPYTVDHQRRVTQIACSIGKVMGLAKDRLRGLRLAGMLHDLGKIAIPTDLLSKPGKLTPLEFALVKTHPQVGFNILKPIKLFKHSAEIILQHHERLDGTGYPRGLKGEEILLEARILGVADVLEAMCSHRPYRASLGLTEAIAEITRNKGILYDAAVVETCLKLYGQDLPATRPVTAAWPPAEAAFPSYLPPSLEVAPAQGHFAHLSALPPKAKDHRRRRSSWLESYRFWMQWGTTSLMGLLMVMSCRG
jgi:HD-GYP domain-containing protein (c-di-GMP phosphodiesterase class II)